MINYCFKDSNSWGDYFMMLLAKDHYTGRPSAFAAVRVLYNIAGSVTLYGRVIAVVKRVDNCTIAAIQQVPYLRGNIIQCFKIEDFYFQFISALPAVVVNTEI